MMKLETITRLQKSEIFEEETKKQIIKYYDLLNENQIQKIIQALDYEKNLLLEYLVSLKDNWLVDFDTIRNDIYALNKKSRYNEELNEKLKENWDILNLLDNL